MFEKVIDFIMGKKEEKLEYPDEFILVDYSKPALEDGTESDLVKNITFYTFNRFGRRIIKVYPYTEEQLHALLVVHKIPYFDKTSRKIKYPVFAKINPSEVIYIEWDLCL